MKHKIVNKNNGAVLKDGFPTKYAADTQAQHKRSKNSNTTKGRSRLFMPAVITRLRDKTASPAELADQRNKK